MSSQRQSRIISGTSLNLVAVGLIVLVVPLASIWYFLRNSVDSVEYDRALDDSSTDDEDLAYGSGTRSDNGRDSAARTQFITTLTSDSSSAPINPAIPPTNLSEAQNSEQSKLEELEFAASCAAALSAKRFVSRRRVHIPQSVPEDYDGSGEELVNAGTMQVKGIRSVRGDMGEYITRE